MTRFILLIAVLAIALIVWYKIRSASGEDKRKIVMTSIIGGVVAMLVILAATGHLNVLTAAIASAFAVLPRYAGMIMRYLPFAKKMYDQHAGKNNAQQGGQQGNQQGGGAQPARAAMAREEAMQVLGLKEGFSRDDVIKAHRRMMQKVHPDRGGSDYLASQINKAKDSLLG